MTAPDAVGASQDAAGSPALIEARSARIAVDDVVAIDHLDLVSHVDRLCLVGDADVFVGALTGAPLHGATPDDDPANPARATVVAGQLLLCGRSAAEPSSDVGVALMRAPLPLSWTVIEYLTWSARLSGLEKKAAVAVAEGALARSMLAPSGARRRLAVLSDVERRLLILAAGVMLEPSVLIAAGPLDGLDNESAAYVHDALMRATDGRRAVFSVGRVVPGEHTSELAQRAQEAVIFRGASPILSGPTGQVLGASGERLYVATVRAHAEVFREELAARGIGLEGGPLRYAIRLAPDRSLHDVFQAAHAARAPISELVPLR